MSDLDLDINNYNIHDLEAFFRLSSTYTKEEVITREYELRNLLLSSGQIDTFFKRDLIAFLEEGKSRLLEKMAKIQPHTSIYHNTTTVPDHFPQPTLPLPSREESIIPSKNTQYIYTQPSEYFPGTLNPLDRRTTEKCLSIDTRFRPPMSVHSDFTFTLPSRVTKVLSMSCSAFEMDYGSLYNISATLNNNYIYISICTD